MRASCFTEPYRAARLPAAANGSYRSVGSVPTAEVRILFMIAARLALIALALIAVLAGPLSAAEQTRTSEDALVQRAVFAEGRLWLLGGERLSNVAEGGERI